MEQLIHRIALRVSTTDYKQLKRTANNNNQTVSQYLRHLIQDSIYGKND